MVKAKWTMGKVNPGDKEITVWAGDIRVMVDHDDCDHAESERIARFILAMQARYKAWKADNAPHEGRDAALSRAVRSNDGL